MKPLLNLELLNATAGPIIYIAGKPSPPAAAFAVGGPIGEDRISQTDWSPLAGRQVILWPDAPDYIGQVAQQLLALTPPAEVYLPDLAVFDVPDDSTLTFFLDAKLGGIIDPKELAEASTQLMANLYGFAAPYAAPEAPDANPLATAPVPEPPTPPAAPEPTAPQEEDDDPRDNGEYVYLRVRNVPRPIVAALKHYATLENKTRDAYVVEVLTGFVYRKRHPFG